MGAPQAQNGQAPSLHGEAKDLLLVAAGAIPGALLRWRLENDLIANWIGCLLLGVITARRHPQARAMLLGGIGFCGSLTTFSGWILQLARQLQRGQVLAMLGSLVPALAGGLVAVALGMAIGTRLGLRGRLPSETIRR